MVYTQPLNVQNPLQIFGSKLKHWYNPSSIVSTDGYCSTWTDVGSLANYNMTQSTANKRPAVITSSMQDGMDFNGESYVWFKPELAISQWMVNKTQLSMSNGLFYFVCKIPEGNNQAVLCDRWYVSPGTLKGIYCVWVNRNYGSGAGNGHFQVYGRSGASFIYSELFYQMMPQSTLVMFQFGKRVADTVSRTFWGNNFIYANDLMLKNSSKLPTDCNYSSYDNFQAGFVLGNNQNVYDGRDFTFQCSVKIAEFGMIDSTTPQMTNAKLILLKRYILNRYNISI